MEKLYRITAEKGDAFTTKIYYQSEQFGEIELKGITGIKFEITADDPIGRATISVVGVKVRQ